MAESGVKKQKLNLVQLIFYWKLLLLQRMFTRFTHLTSPKKILGLKNCRFSGTTEDRRDAIDTLIKWLNFSENSGWVYIISTSGRKQYNTFCVSFKQWGCRATLYFWHRYIDLPPQYLQRQCFDVPFTKIWFLVSSFTLLATFRGNASDFAGLFLLKDSKIVITTSLWNSNILFFCFCTVRKRFHAFSIEALTAHVKTGHHHFFDLMRTLYVDTNWSNRSTLPVFACCSPQKVSALVHQLVSWLTLTTIELCWQDYK